VSNWHPQEEGEGGGFLLWLTCHTEEEEEEEGDKGKVSGKEGWRRRKRLLKDPFAYQ